MRAGDKVRFVVKRKCQDDTAEMLNWNGCQLGLVMRFEFV